MTITMIEKQVTTIQQVEAVVKRELPDCWHPLEACLSIIGATVLKDVDHCIGLIFVGSPGGRKSTTLELLGSKEPFYLEHRFTPASFVSHSATATEDELKEIDLLPRIRHKIVVIPELAPTFSQRQEDLENNIATLTAVMDGRGYSSDSGVHGRRGYQGDYRFGMIAATTPLQHKDWQALGKLSSRWIFYTLGEQKETIDLREDFRAKKERCKSIVQAFLKDFWKGYAAVDWDRHGDPKLYTEALSNNAKAICRWRGLVPRQDAQGYNPPVIEVSNRLAETLYALTRGHALLRGSSQITGYDERFIANLNMTNMPQDRVQIYFSLYPYDEFKDDYAITLADAMRALKCNNTKAKRVLGELQDLGVIRYYNRKYYRLV